MQDIENIDGIIITIWSINMIGSLFIASRVVSFVGWGMALMMYFVYLGAFG